VRRFAGGLALGLVLAWAALALSQGTPAPGSFRISGPDGAMARVSHFGGLMVTIVGGDYGVPEQEMKFAHLNQMMHVSGRVILTNVAGAPVSVTGTALDVNCTGCSAASVVSVDHVTSVTHVAGTVRLSAVDGTVATLTGSSLNVNCTGGCAGGVNTPVNQSGSWVVTASHVANMPAVSQGGAWVLQGAHQAGEWNIRHISSTVHIAGTVALSGSPSVSQSGSWTVQAAHQGGAWTVNVAHVSGQLHIAAIHASGALRASRVTSCGTSAATVVATNTARRELWLTNMGTVNIYLGYGTTGHVALTTANGWPMHAASSSTGLAYPVKLREYAGPVSCIADGPNQQLGVLEVLKN